MCQECLGNQSLCTSPRGIISALPDCSAAEPETTTTAREAAGLCAVDINNQGNTIVPALSSDLCHLTSDLCPSPVQPVTDITSYLATRKPCAHCSDEQSLFITLPDALREEIENLLAAFDLVDDCVKARLSVNKSCQQIFHGLNSQPSTLNRLSGSWKTFRAKYDLYCGQANRKSQIANPKSRDWVCLVNRTKAGAAWQDRDDGLSALFLEFAEKRIARFARADGEQQALISVQRQFRTGRNIDGEQEPIPGYGDRPMTLNGRPVTGGYWQDWFSAIGYQQLAMPRRPLPAECPCEPPGWTLGNIRRQIKSRAKLTRPVRLLLQQGVSAAKQVLPYHLRSRRDLRFLEEITFDDVRTDWVIRDTATGAVCELWLLIARDQATAMVLGFVMHLSVMREDGSKPHLGLKEMKQLAAWLLERYPLPPYESRWIVERGTATLSEGSASALAEILPGHITIHYTSMIGGISPAGYREKKKGNAGGKASHESHNRLIHTATSFLPGQTGSRWDIRPADLNARVAECVEYWKLSQRLPDHLRGQVQYSLLDWTQARENLFRIFIEQNFRQHHALEGFDRVVEWLDRQSGKWMPQNTFPAILPSTNPSIPTRTRMEMPVERAIKLMAPYAGQWKKASPHVIITFLAHTAKQITKSMIKPAGEIIFTYEGSPLIFAPPAINHQLSQLSTALGYYNPDDPRFLHVTSGKGSILGTWYRRDRTGGHDQDLLQEAMRYTANALKAAQAIANDLTTDDRIKHDALRLHNAELERGNEFIEVTPSIHQSTNPPIQFSTIASALSSVPRIRRQAKDTKAADEALASALDAM